MMRRQRPANFGSKMRTGFAQGGQVDPLDTYVTGDDLARQVKERYDSTIEQDEKLRRGYAVGGMVRQNFRRGGSANPATKAAMGLGLSADEEKEMMLRHQLYTDTHPVPYDPSYDDYDPRLGTSVTHGTNLDSDLTLKTEPGPGLAPVASTTKMGEIAGYTRYAGGGVVRRTGYADGGEVVDESAGLDTRAQLERRQADEQARLFEQQQIAEQQARRFAQQQQQEPQRRLEQQAAEQQAAEQQAARAAPRQLAQPDVQPDVQTPVEQPLTGYSQTPVTLSEPPPTRSAQDVLAYAHNKYLGDTSIYNAPTGAEMPPTESLTGQSGVVPLLTGVANRAISQAAQTGDTSGYNAPTGAEIRPDTGSWDAMAAYARGEHAVPSQVLDQHLQHTVASNPAEAAVKVVTNPNLDQDQQAGLLAGMGQRYQLHNAMAQGALAHGDVAGAIRLAQEAHNHVPDGQNLSFRQDGDRIIATVDPLGKRPPVDYSMTLQQFHDYLVGPATSFDHVVANGVAKNLEIASGAGAQRDTGYGAALAGGRGMEQPTLDPAAGAAALAGGPASAPAATDVSARARNDYTPANVDETGAPTYGGATGYRPAAVDETGAPTYGGGAQAAAPAPATASEVSQDPAFAPGERVPLPRERPNTKEAQAIRPWGGNLTDPEVGWDKEATGEIGGGAKTRGERARESERERSRGHPVSQEGATWWRGREYAPREQPVTPGVPMVLGAVSDRTYSRYLGAGGDRVSGHYSDQRAPPGGGLPRGVTLIRTPGYTKMRLDEGAKPIIDRRGYIRGWQSVPGYSDFDPIPPSANAAPPGTRGTPRADGTYDTQPLPDLKYSNTAPPVWNPDQERPYANRTPSFRLPAPAITGGVDETGAPTYGGGTAGQSYADRTAGQPERPVWRPPSGPHETGPPPPAGDNSPEARAARNYPMASQAKQRQAAVEQYTKDDRADALEYEKLASAERKGELTNDQKIQIEDLRDKRAREIAAGNVAGRQGVAETQVAGRQTLQEQKDRAHAERQQNWINFRNDKTAQEIAQKVLTSRENQLIRLYDTHLATGTAPPPDAVEAAKKLAAAVNAAGYQAPALPADIPAGATPPAARAPAPAAAPAASVAPAAPAAPRAVPAGSLWSPSRRQWKSPDGTLFDAGGNPIGP